MRDGIRKDLLVTEEIAESSDLYLRARLGAFLKIRAPDLSNPSKPTEKNCDYIHDSRTDPSSGFLRADEGTVSPAWYVTAGAGEVTEVREAKTRQLREELMAEQFDQESKEHAGT